MPGRAGPDSRRGAASLALHPLLVVGGDSLVLADHLQQRLQLPPLLLRGARLGEELSGEAQIFTHVLERLDDAPSRLVELGLAIVGELLHQLRAAALDDREHTHPHGGERDAQQEDGDQGVAHGLNRSTLSRRVEIASASLRLLYFPTRTLYIADGAPFTGSITKAG